MRFSFVKCTLTRFFANYVGWVIAYPVPFFFLPLVLSAFLSSGLLKHSDAFIKDDLQLYTPTDAKARKELTDLESMFYINDSDPYYTTRRYDIKRTGFVIVTSDREDGDILDPLSLQAAMHLWSVIQSFTIQDFYDNRVNYPSMCVKFPIPANLNEAIRLFTSTNMTGSNLHQFCVSNPLVEAFKFILLSDARPALFPNTTTNKSTISGHTIQQMADAFSLESLGVANLLGGVSFDKGSKKISGAKAIMLPYALKHSTDMEDKLAEKWELKLADFLLSFQSPVIRTSWWTYETLAAESSRDREQLKRMLLPCFVAVSLYTLAMCCTFSWISSRPLLAVGGVLSSAISISSSVGLLLHCGLRMTSIAYCMPFIVFSVGVDNVFIFLSSWRASFAESSLEERLALTFGDAGVTITITSLTDIISFGVGCFAPFPSVQIFCVYATVAVLFNYFYQLTFFASIMYWTCVREVQQRHCFTMRRVNDKINIQTISAQLHSINSDDASQPPKYSPCKPSLHMQPQVSRRKCREEDFMLGFEKNHCLSKFFYTHYSDFLLYPTVRVAIICIFSLYLVAASYGCFYLKLGLEPNDLLPDDSYGKKSLQVSQKYFSEYGSILHVWMHNLSKIDLGHRRLRTFLNAQNKAGLFVTESNFVPLVKQFLNQSEFRKYNRDVILDSTAEQLEASRVPIHLRYVGFKNQSRAMHLFRNLAAGSSLPTSVYADFFLFAEQYGAVLTGTLSSILIAGVAVTFVSLLLIPVPMAAFWVSFSILSINLGVLGFMSIWSIRLDFISMRFKMEYQVDKNMYFRLLPLFVFNVLKLLKRDGKFVQFMEKESFLKEHVNIKEVTIVMSIGFCVDFAAHLAHSFAKEENIASAQRLRNALYTVGTPILQSASSTILGVSFMACTETYIFRSFLKTIVLVIVLGVLHGIVVLPVLLTTFYRDKKVLDLRNKSENYSTEMMASGSYPRQSHPPFINISYPLPNTVNAFKKNPSYMDELHQILFNQQGFEKTVSSHHFSNSYTNSGLTSHLFKVYPNIHKISCEPPGFR